MLRSFRLGNHRSFRDEQELLLMPALPGDNRPAVPVAAIYGANASGKSNLLDGLGLVKELVAGQRLSGTGRLWRAVPTTGLEVQKPFRLASGMGEEPSVFVTEMLADGVPHTYGFVLKGGEILEEWLYSYPEKRKRLLFERSGSKIKTGSTLTEVRAKIGLLEEIIRPNTLLLRECERLDLGPLAVAYRWFEQRLNVVEQNEPARGGFLSQWVGGYLVEKPERFNRVLSLLKVADVGIVDIMVLDLSGHHGDENRRELEVRLAHGPQQEFFDLADESAGTRNWLELLPSVLDTLDQGKVLVVDELETSLHPALVTRLIGLFRNEATNLLGAQLIFTTHDTSLLGTMLGGDVLARDEIWFVDKTAEGASELYPLTDFKPRKDQNTERRYLAGAYGAVPVLGDFAEALQRG
ncbi:MAG TPA: ATP-binding protein [Amycolatopsis sp.]|jgi:hypothetical protein